ncbi:unnamed protein product [Agarophyton chilense]|eukprot:gb/GEZJ01000773.1/.p1 GENE.gb/GEZJ01000773.1/~~gb/GEZJ01000773.1/.p1  ORF type:complete len:135 (-),score=19.90 gb/GEZJ01000773.1/:384-788(-)
MIKIIVTLTALFAAACAVPLAAPAERSIIKKKIPIFIPPLVIIDKGTAIGGPGGNGGSASATGAIVTGGIGGSGVSGAKGLFNKGIIAGGDGVFSGNVANGAAGNVFGKGGSITGTFTNQAVAGNGGPGGPAFA